jgi:hypothetical protein
LVLDIHPGNAWVVGVQFSWTTAFVPPSTNGCHCQGWHVQAKETKSEC